jgi:hypothetical protein
MNLEDLVQEVAHALQNNNAITRLVVEGAVHIELRFHSKIEDTTRAVRNEAPPAKRGAR